MKPIKPNPGGQLAPEEILGRDKLITELWDILEGRNIYMNDLRRIGKTMILRKMEAEPRTGWLVMKRDLGGIKTAAAFATQVYRDTLGKLGTKKQVLRRMSDLLDQSSGAQIAGILMLPDGRAAPWMEVLSRTFADLHEEYANGNERLVFLWDEFPFLIDNIRVTEGAQTAMDVLDVLRSLSQDYDSIRLLLTGSVGIHHVLERLQEEGYNGSPLNTFERKSPGPLAHEEAVRLAKHLIEGAKLKTSNPSALAEAAATLAGDVPFYIHRLISRAPKDVDTTPEILTTLLERELCATDDDWNLEHYRKRLSTYYPGKGDESIILIILDHIATAKENSLPLPEIVNALNPSISGGADQDRVRQLLKLLVKDHYLTQEGDGSSFRLKLVQHWWMLDRDLSNTQAEERA
ncbi:MAG: hypothetical protein V3V05_12170 [Pontiella sp.]